MSFVTFRLLLVLFNIGNATMAKPAGFRVSGFSLHVANLSNQNDRSNAQSTTGGAAWVSKAARACSSALGTNAKKNGRKAGMPDRPP